MNETSALPDLFEWMKVMERHTIYFYGHFFLLSSWITLNIFHVGKWAQETLMWAPTQPSWIPSPSHSLISHKAFTIQKSKLASDELGYSVSDSWLHSWKSIPNCPLFSNAASSLLCLRRSGTLFNLSLLYRSIVQGAVMNKWYKRRRMSWPENVLPRKSFQAHLHAQQQKAALQTCRRPLAVFQRWATMTKMHVLVGFGF